MRSTFILTVIFLFLLTGFASAQCSPSGVAGTVNICSPAANSTVASPVNFQAAATPISGRVITAIRLYIDNVAQSTTNSNTYDGTFTVAAGTHNVVFNAWDNPGAVYSTKETITVGTQQSCSPVAGVVTICSPASGATVSSPVSIQAVAGAPSGQTITAMKLYVDSVSTASSTNGSLTTSQTLANGTHKISVNAWTSGGTVIKASESITVGSSTPTVSVAISPTSANLAPGAAQQFNATVSGSTNTSVTWSVDGVVGGSGSGGTITSSGLYTAPGASGTHTVTATSQADTTKSANASVTVGSTSGCSPTAGVVTICAPAAGSTVASPVTFQAVAGAPAGQTITAMKLYVDSVGQFTSNGSTLNGSVTIATGTHNIVVNAWESSGTVIKGSETITVSANTTPSVSISPTSATVVVNGTQQFNATVQNLTPNTVTWSVDGTAGGSPTIGTITTGGLYTAPSTTGTHSVTATSDADASKTATASVNVVNTPPPSGSNVYTYMNDNNRSGLNSSETTLTPAAVSGGTFAKRGTWSLDAASYTQPLFVQNVTVNGASHNVLYVATENDSLYALDADHPGTVLWKRNLIPSGATIGRSYACSGTTCDGRSSDLGSSIGVTGTPVIDPNTNWLYIVTKTTENNNQVYRLHAIDIRNGNDAMGSAVLHGSAAGTGDGSVNGTVTFNPLTHNQREGLLLSNGVIYIPFASYSDHRPYHGWLLAYNASSLSYIDAFLTTPNTSAGGFWSAGAAPAGDADGNVYIASANQLVPLPSTTPYSTGMPALPGEIPNALLKLKLVGSTLTLADYFSPYNTKCLSNDDLDLGSAAPMLIPTAFAGHNMVAIGSKEGRVYLVDRDNMGKFNSGSDSQILASKLFNPLGACGSSGFNADTPWRVYGAPAYWNGNIYFGSSFGPIRQYNITGGTLNQVALGTHTYAASGQSGRGPLTAVSSNGNTGAIVWTLENDLNSTSTQGWLRAYDATNVSKQLFVSNFGGGANFIIPTITHGHVYFAARNIVYSYGVN